MKTHIPREEIFAWMDHEAEPAVAERVRRHLAHCPDCRRLRDELAGTTALFREMDVLEPPSYIWTRISAEYENYKPRRRFFRLAPAGKVVFLHARTAALAATLLVGLGITAIYWSSARMEQRQLAQLENACRASMPQDPESFNPFTASPWFDLQENPFARTLDGALPKRR